MDKDYYEIKKDCSHKETVKSSIIQRLNEIISVASEDVKVTIEKLSKRSQNALAAYWVLINSVVKWSNEQGNSYSDKDFDEWFKKEAGLVERTYMMRFWKAIHKEKLSQGWTINEDDQDDDRQYFISLQNPKDYNDFIYLGKEEYEDKTRSISNKGDVTKIEMELLLNTVLKFGADNDIPNCEIKNGELDKLLKFYERN